MDHTGTRAAVVGAVVVSAAAFLFATHALVVFGWPFGVALGILDTLLLLTPGGVALGTVLVTAVAVARPRGRRWPPGLAGAGMLGLLAGTYYGGARCAHSGGQAGVSVSIVGCGQAINPLLSIPPCLALVGENCVMIVGLGTIVAGSVLLGAGLWYSERVDAFLDRRLEDDGSGRAMTLE
jgi:hypothetical protein